MDFDIKKPIHIFALILIAITFLIFVIHPFISYFGMSISTQSNQINEISKNYKAFFSIIILAIQLIIVLVLLVAFPFIWYYLVNNFNLNKILSHLKLRTKCFHEAFLWGIITMVIAFFIIILIGTLMIFMGFNLEDYSNIPELESYFSLPAMLILITFQPIGEEIFFRGFLLEKIKSIKGEKTAIIFTAFLFGVAHLSFGNLYPAFMTFIIGFLLAFIVIKTKNLFSAITAHILFNVVSFSFYFIGKFI